MAIFFCKKMPALLTQTQNPQSPTLLKIKTNKKAANLYFKMDPIK